MHDVLDGEEMEKIPTSWREPSTLARRDTRDTLGPMLVSSFKSYCVRRKATLLLKAVLRNLNTILNFPSGCSRLALHSAAGALIVRYRLAV